MCVSECRSWTNLSLQINVIAEQDTSLVIKRKHLTGTLLMPPRTLYSKSMLPLITHAY